MRSLAVWVWFLASLPSMVLGAEEVFKRFGDAPATPVREPFVDGRFELRPGETIAFLGQANLVREQKAGELEARLARAFAQNRPRFRSMAWEGDTVYEQWRDLNFGSWAEQLAYTGVTVIMAQFGQVEALDGVERVGEFKTAYGQLLDQLLAHTPRIVLISPMPFERPPSSDLPDLSKRDVEVYSEAVRQLARARGVIFVDLYAPLSRRSPQAPRLTGNGMHLSETGLVTVAQTVLAQLGLPAFDSLGITLRQSIVEKNRLWFDVWRPMNWAFAYGDRTHVEFGQPPGPGPWLKEELEQFKALLGDADARIQALAADEPVRSLAPLESTPSPPERMEDPAETLASFEVPEGFSVNLFASEREGVINPIQMVWDERGRLWVACSPTYPHIEPGAPPGDYILVCEDNNRDGVADRSWKFAERLSMVQGLELGGGGLYVTSGTELLHLPDENRDGRADSRRVVVSGFGTGDTHQLINSLIYGPDGTLWFTQGLHIYSRVETPWGVERLDKSGVWRMDPRRLRLDAFFNRATAGHNCWGVAFDDFGQVFHKSGDRAEGYYTVPGMARVDRPAEYHPLGALFGSTAKTTALDFIGTRRLPAELQGAAVLGGFIAGEVELHRLADDGAGFKSEQLPKLLRSSSTAFRPVDVSVGPDGAIYAADFHNRLIGHYQTSYRDPQRDKWHGRIWRITWEAGDRADPPTLEGMSQLELFRQFKSTERWRRLQAGRLLFSAPKAEVMAALELWLLELQGQGREWIDTAGVLQAHGVVRPDVLRTLLTSEDARVRAYGARMIGAWSGQLTNALELLSAAVHDSHPRVRLEAVVACSYLFDPRAAELAAEVLDHPRDRFVDYALGSSLRALKFVWEPALLSGQLTFGGRPERLAFVMDTGIDSRLAGRLSELVRQGKVSGPARLSLLLALVRSGGPADLAVAFELGSSEAAVLAELTMAAELRQVKPEGDPAPRLRPLLHHGEPALAVTALGLCAAWNERSLAAAVRAVAEDAAQPSPVRAAAIQAAGRLEGIEAMDWLNGFLQGSPAFQGPTLSALSRIDLEAAAAHTARLMVSAADQTRMSSLMRPLLGRRGGTEALAAALEGVPLPVDAAKLARQVLFQAGRDDQRLSTVLARAAGLSGNTPDYDVQRVRTLAKEVADQGDGARGRKVYDALGCAQCHRLEGVGGQTGPDLTALGKAMPLELLIESVLWPKRQVKEGYLSTEVETKQGDYIQGYRLTETDDVLTLREVLSGSEIRIGKADIASRREAGTIMPDGLTDGLSQAALADLLRFLSTR